MINTIKNFDELLEYFKRPEIEFEHIEKICHEGLCVFFTGKHTKEEAIKLITDYWNKWGGKNVERPIFIDADIDLEDK